jgi:hypothetical protein
LCEEVPDVSSSEEVAHTFAVMAINAAREKEIKVATE